MKRLLVLVFLFALVLSCSDEETLAPIEPCTPAFYADSLEVEIELIYFPLLRLNVWVATADYKCRLEGCRGKIHTHQFEFSEIPEILTDYDDSIADCIEPVGIDLYKTGEAVSTNDDIFTGYDSVTVYFTLKGLFQQCSGSSADSIDAIVWSDTLRVRLND